MSEKSTEPSVVLPAKFAERSAFSVAEVASILGVSRAQGYIMAKTGLMPGVIKVGERRLVVARWGLERLLSGGFHENARPAA